MVGRRGAQLRGKRRRAVVGKLIGVDPWMVNPFHAKCGEVDLQSGEGQDCLAGNVDAEGLPPLAVTREQTFHFPPLDDDLALANEWAALFNTKFFKAYPRRDLVVDEETLVAFPGAVLFVTHDRRFLRALATLIVSSAFAAGTLCAADSDVLTLDRALRAAETHSQILTAYDASARASRERAVAAAQLPDPVLQLALDNLPAEGDMAFSLDEEPMTMQKVGVMQAYARSSKREARSTQCKREAETAELRREVGLGERERTVRQSHLAHGRAGGRAQYFPIQHPGSADLVRGARL